MSSEWILEAGDGWVFIWPLSAPSSSDYGDQDCGATPLQPPNLRSPPPASHHLTSGGLAISLSTYQQSIRKSYHRYSVIFLYPSSFDRLFHSILFQIILLFLGISQIPNISYPSGSRSCLPSPSPELLEPQYLIILLEFREVKRAHELGFVIRVCNIPRPSPSCALSVPNLLELQTSIWWSDLKSDGETKGEDLRTFLFWKMC